MSKLPRVIRSIPEIIEWRKTTQNQRVGFVPTMGALHEGHATLLRRQRQECDVSVLSIFVNPTQFGPNEDLGAYPRTFEKDLEIAAKEGVDIVFFPTPEEIYPPGYTTYVEETSLSTGLCGALRPGHFRGVTTVVLKLFNLVRPHVAFFGMKDAQQFYVIAQMAHDLNLDISIVGVPTVRESDGLAMSSRNTYLSQEERAQAPKLYQTLLAVRDALGKGLAIETTLEQAQAELSAQNFRVQYLECVETPSLKPARGSVEIHRSYLIAVATYLGKTRLIDNVTLGTHST